MKYNDVAILDYEKGDSSIGELTSLMKKKGFRVKRSYSPYVGHGGLVICFDKLVELRKALSLLCQNGFCKNVSFRYKQIVNDLRYHLPYAGWIIR
jgi:hypothetical protein